METSTVEDTEILKELVDTKETALQVVRMAQNEALRRRLLTLPPTAMIETFMAPTSPAHLGSKGKAKLAPVDEDTQEGPLSPERFEEKMTASVSEAVERKSRPDKPFDDSDVDKVRDLLLRIGKPKWADRPRTYLILRLIDEVGVMDSFVLEGRKDIHFPYTVMNLPDCLSDQARRAFLQQQKLVLSQRHLDIVKGGRHRHFGAS
jgi:hypothetical protein